MFSKPNSDLIVIFTWPVSLMPQSAPSSAPVGIRHTSYTDAKEGLEEHRMHAVSLP